MKLLLLPVLLATCVRAGLGSQLQACGSALTDILSLVCRNQFHEPTKRSLIPSKNNNRWFLIRKIYQIARERLQNEFNRSLQTDVNKDGILYIPRLKNLGFVLSLKLPLINIIQIKSKISYFKLFYKGKTHREVGITNIKSGLNENNCLTCNWMFIITIWKDNFSNIALKLL